MNTKTSTLRQLAQAVEQQGQGENPVLNAAATELRRAERTRRRLVALLRKAYASLDHDERDAKLSDAILKLLRDLGE